MTRLPARLTASALALALGLAACGPGPELRPALAELPGCVEIPTERVVFDPVDVAEAGASSSAYAVVRNGCGGVLLLDDVRVEGALAAAFQAGPPDRIALRSGEQARIPIRFEPAAVELHGATLVVSSNDPAEREAAIELVGEGEGARLEITPGTADYGAATIGCEQRSVHTLTNRGTATLGIDEVRLLTDVPDAFRLDLDPLTNGDLPFSLEPNERVNIRLNFTPLDQEPHEAVLQVQSTDPGRPISKVEAGGVGISLGRRTDTFERPVIPQVDVLFSIDRSTTLEFYRTLAASADEMIREFARLGVDARVAAVAGDDGCIVGADPYIDTSFSASQAEKAFLAMADLDKTLSPYGNNEERGFTVVEAALGARTERPPECNRSFYREEADLALVFTSDESEQSLLPWEHYVLAFQSLKADPRDVRVHAIAGDYPSGCGIAAAGSGFYEATVATEGLFVSICNPVGGEQMRELARASVPTDPTAFRPSATPVIPTLEVRVDGVPMLTGWAYDVSRGSIVFERGFLPPRGSTIEVEYDAMPDCEDPQ